MGDLVFTHLQIRGSVPAFFAQTGINGIAGEMVIERTADLTRGSFKKHFDMLSQIYKRIFSVNLLSEKKSDEKQLSNFYEELVDANTHDMQYLRYQFYDFHE
jgi:synaptojanin